MKTTYFYSVLFFVFINLTLYSEFGFTQCCSAGSPLGASTYGGIVEKNNIRFSTFLRYSISNDYYTGAKKETDYGLLSYTDFLFQGLTLAYGISKKINIETEIGYFYHKSQFFKTEPSEPQMILKGYGLSNGIIAAKYALYKKPSKGWEVTVGAGIKFPFSNKPQYVDNALLPEDIQPSTSAFGWVAQMIIQKEYKPQKITLFMYNRYEQNALNENNYKYGDRLRTSIILSKKIKKHYGLMLQARYEFINQDVSNDNIQTNTGANLIFVSPQFLYSLKGKWNFIIGADFPVYKNYHGTQMSNSYAVSLSLTHDLSLKKKEVSVPNN